MIDVYRFDGEGVRVVMDEHGDPWFIASDVARALGYRDAHNAVRGLDEDERGTHTLSTLGGFQELLTVSESGVYSLIIRSRVPGARRFKRWLTREVLPSIRKTGGYQAVDPMQVLSDPASLRQLLGSYAERVELLEAENAEARHKVEIYDRIIDTGDTMGFREAAKLVRAATGANESEFRTFLIRRRWAQRLGGRLAPAHYGETQSYVTVREREFVAHDGSRKVSPELRITQRGLARAIDRLINEEEMAS